MLFYDQETSIAIILACLPAILSVYAFLVADQKRVGIFLLLLSAIALRFVMISLDSFVHPWDERYHALVAKNMITWPFKPMLISRPVLAYDPHDWAYNHIWLHKQPFFLWQMAASMKVFGVNTLALRLPSAIIGVVMVWFTYDIARHWIKIPSVAFIAAFLMTLSHYILEMTSGHYMLDHNDLTFLFYITAALWALTRYIYIYTESGSWKFQPDVGHTGRYFCGFGHTH